MNVRPSIRVLLRCTRDKEDLKSTIILLLFYYCPIRHWSFLVFIRLKTQTRNVSSQCRNNGTPQVYKVAFLVIFFFCLTFFVVKIIETRHAFAIVKHKPLVTVEQTIWHQIASTQVDLFVRVQTAPLFGFDTYKTFRRNHFIAPYFYVCAGTFGYHHSPIDRQGAWIPNHNLWTIINKQEIISKIVLRFSISRTSQRFKNKDFWNVQTVLK